MVVPVLISSIFLTAAKLQKVDIIGKHTKTDNDSLNSFRPISLVNNLGKNLEKVILSRLQWHSGHFNWMSGNQHGFSPGKSTEAACHALLSFVKKARLTKQTPAVTFLHIFSQFDAAWHPAILTSLIQRGCPFYFVRLLLFVMSHRYLVHYFCKLIYDFDS